MKAKKSITWLHISDRHFSSESAQTPPSIIGDKLLEDIEKRVEFSPSLEKIDFLFFTGDLVFHGQEKEYVKVYEDFLEPIMKKLDLKKERVFILPGNHEIDREWEPEYRMRIREKDKLELHDIEEIYKNEKYKSIIFQPFKDYFHFIGNWFSHIDTDTGNFIKLVKVGELSVEITGMNTAWLAYGGKEKKEKLSIGLPSLRELIKKGDKNADLRILLIHHPLDILKDCEEEYGNIFGFIQNRIDIIFHGHLHEKNYKPYPCSLPEGEWLIIPCGAIYTSDELQPEFDS